jgi:hypothetical protein
VLAFFYERSRPSGWPKTLRNQSQFKRGIRLAATGWPEIERFFENKGGKMIDRVGNEF